MTVVGGEIFPDCTAEAPHTGVTRPRTDGLAVHHTTDGQLAWPDERAKIRALAAYDRRTWGNSSYHAYAFASGNIYVVGDGSAQLAGVAYENDHLEGIVLVGNFAVQAVPPAMVAGVGRWVRAKWAQHGRLPVKGHRQWVDTAAHPFWATACPGDYGVAALAAIVAAAEGDEMTAEQLARLENLERQALSARADLNALANAQEAVTQHNDVRAETPKLSLKGLWYIAGKAWPF